MGMSILHWQQYENEHDLDLNIFQDSDHKHISKILHLIS